MIRLITLGSIGIAAVAPVSFPTTDGTQVDPPTAAPRIIMFHGGELDDQRVHMVDWYENLAFMLAISTPMDTVPPTYSRGEHVEIAMYWHGPTWEAHAQDTTLLKTLRPERGQQSRLYLAAGEFRAFVEFPVYIKHRAISDTGLMILRKYGIPLNAAQTAGSSVPAHELASMHAAAVESWVRSPSADGHRIIPYRLDSTAAGSPLPMVAPMFDTTAMRNAGIDPDVELVPLDSAPTEAERRLIEDSVMTRSGIRLLYLTDEMQQEMRGGPPGIGFSDAFHARFPESRGYLTFSRASLDRAGTLASLSVTFICGGRCGGGSNHLLRRQPRGWEPALQGSIGWVY
jgi:hypothetical protein